MANADVESDGQNVNIRTLAGSVLVSDTEPVQWRDESGRPECKSREFAAECAGLFWKRQRENSAAHQPDGLARGVRE